MGIRISLILVLKVIADIKDPTDMIEHVPSKIIKIKLINENTTWILKKIKNGIKNKSSAMMVKIMIEIILLKKTKPRSIGAASQLQIASWFFSKKKDLFNPKVEVNKITNHKRPDKWSGIKLELFENDKAKTSITVRPNTNMEGTISLLRISSFKSFANKTINILAYLQDSVSFTL